jgi:hypothetical protein
MGEIGTCGGKKKLQIQLIKNIHTACGDQKVNSLYKLRKKYIKM